MKDYGRTYWFTWGFLILAASFAGVGGVKAAFFGGLVAALASTALTRPYQRLGARYAPLLGAVLGVLWAIGKLYCVRWTGDAEDYAFARWNIGTDIAIHAAGFAGGALLAALAVRQPLGRSMLAGGVLAAAMTAVPYGFIDWVDYRVAGPVEVVLFVTADVRANEAPQRRPGAEMPVLALDEIKALKESALVVEGPGGVEALDDAGRRYWPIWRKRFTYPGNRGGPVRRVIVLMPPDEVSAEDGLPVAGAGLWKFNVGEDPKGVAVVRLASDGVASIQAKPFRPIALTLAKSELTNARALARPFQFCSVAITRESPFGNFYLPDPVKSGLPYAFDFVYTDAVRLAREAEAKRNKDAEPAVPPREAAPTEGKKLLPRGGELTPIPTSRGSNSQNVDLPPAQK